MPLVPAPNTGYPDWQRTANYDLAPLLQWNHPLGSGAESSSVIAMGHYGYLAGTIQITSGDVLVQMLCATDIGMANQAGSRQFTLTANIENQAQIYLPVLGPYVEVVVTSTTAGNWAGQANLFASNRIVPLQFTPYGAVILDEIGITVPTGQEAFYPRDYYAGPMIVWADAGSGSYVLVLEYLNASDAWINIDEFSVGVDPGSRITTIAPAGAWRLVTSNPGAAIAGCDIHAIPSQTGST